MLCGSGDTFAPVSFICEVPPLLAMVPRSFSGSDVGWRPAASSTSSCSIFLAMLLCTFFFRFTPQVRKPVFSSPWSFSVSIVPQAPNRCSHLFKHDGQFSTEGSRLSAGARVHTPFKIPRRFRSIIIAHSFLSLAFGSAHASFLFLLLRVRVMDVRTVRRLFSVFVC